MAEYKGIKGFKTQSYASDPVLSGVAGVTWASGGALTTARYQGGSAGTLTAGLCIGGQVPPRSTATEEYNGTAWTAGGALNVARYYGVSAGTQTAALLAGGNVNASPVAYAVTEEYNGTSWTAGNSMQTASTARASAGTQTAAFGCGGRDAPDAYMNQMETYNGTSWTETNNLNTAVSNAGGAGTTTAGLSFGGLRSDPSVTGNTNATEEWDGTSWAAGGTMTSSNRDRGSSGTQTAALGFGGKGPPSNTRVAVTEAYDGSTWTEVADLATARDSGTSAKAGSQTSTFYAGGTTGSAVTTTEEFVAGDNILNEGQIWYNTTGNALKYTANIGSWASGGTLNTARYGLVGAGTNGAAVVAGGRAPPDTDITETYNGSTWTEEADMNVNRSWGASAACTPSTAAIVFGGIDGYPSPTVHDNTEKWNGTSWTEVADLTTGRDYPFGIGAVNTAALCCAGSDPTGVLVEKWDGTSWSEVNDLNQARSQGGRGAGTVTAAVCFAGTPGPGKTTELYDGTSWTEVNDLNTARAGPVAWGSSTSAMCGSGTPITTNCELWNGTCWSETNNMAGGRYDAGYAGVSTGTTNGLAAGGYPPFLNTTEVWNEVDTVKTVTVS